MSLPCRRQTGRAFTITELLVVISILVVLLLLLFPALAGVRESGKMATSMSNMRQIGVWMQLYSGDNREFIVPSRFDYSGNPYAGKVRSESPISPLKPGTWSDILWTVNEVGLFPEAVTAIGHAYRYDSPDAELYRLLDSDIKSPFRSAANMTLPPPAVQGSFGGPSQQSEIGLPGYFAANNFFDADRSSSTFNGWYTTGQIRMPDRSMYLVDSLAGEIIQDEPDPFDAEPPAGESQSTHEVDFRYNDMCLMLFLDGHEAPVAKFLNVDELEGSLYGSNLPPGRQIRVRNLDRRAGTGTP